ncbi:methyltransferase family protein [Idiomarina sp. A28L]|uniref:class I SAM-dependent methyltransferase n=1 Tax=Idiomarina sp. A28L TaxID=1036674 RepID=UPI0002138D39|nr:class I SAM-dependent methyltransferase [Idiomarina sp. A28L]EGN75490.1 methyltransferase family protein [Idiomarina sp. A28L]
MSINYYNENAAEFHADTASVDMAALYEEFLLRLPVGAHIIDAGCGSGRDALAFLKAGFRVTAFDASPALVAIAQERLGTEKVKLATFDEFSISEPSDAIWACASLLHVPFVGLPHTFLHLAEQLKSKGLFYCSFKYGDDEVERGGRRFTNLTEARLADVIQNSDLAIQKTWITGDARPDRENEKWLNAILVKSEGKD